MLALPSTPDRPLPSPELTGPAATPLRDGPAELSPWSVDVLRFAPAEAAQLLGELSDPYPWTSMIVAFGGYPGDGGDSEAELHFGAALRWFVAVHDLAWRTVRGGAVLPRLVTEDGAPHARWRPVPDPVRAAELDALARAAPPSAVRTAARARDLVAEAVDALVDAEVRITMSDQPPLLRPGRPAATGAPARAARAWVLALTSASGAVSGADGAALADLERRIIRWHRSTPWPAAPLRLGFRLTEPIGPDPAEPLGQPSDDGWAIVITAQSVAEPAIVVDAERLWAPGAAIAALERTVPRVVDTFHAEFERAARCWPPLHEASREGPPERLEVDRAGALAFLTEGAGALTDAGFEVRLPAWWRRSPRLGLRLVATAGRAVDPGTVQTSPLLDRDVVVGVRWEPALGDTRLSEADLERLADVAGPLVRLRGQWLVADRPQIEAALAFLRRHGTGAATVGEVLRVGLAAEPTVAGLPVTGVEAPGPLGDVLAGRVPVAPLQLPPEFAAVFRATLRPYQHRGLAWLVTMQRLGLGAVLADDMGLGKTVQALALVVLDRLAPIDPPDPAGLPRSGPTLVVCPMSVVAVWQREAARSAPSLRVHVHHGPARHGTALADVAAGADLVVTTYAIAHRDAERLRAVPWHRLVVDEAQQIKNRAAVRSRAVHSLPARHRLALTGTPVENRLADLHATLDLVNPGSFGSAEAFRERYSVPIERHRNEVAAAQLRRRSRPVVLRRVKTDRAVIADLPDKVELTVPCTLTVEQAALYRAVVRDLLHRVEGRRGATRRGAVLASLSKLKQVCNHPAQFLRDSSRIEGRSGKVARLEETLEEIVVAGERALCFTQFVTFGTLLAPYLQRRLDREVLFLHGGLSRGERERLVSRFTAPGGPPVLLLSLRAAGTGLTLTAANHVLHLDRWWNPAVEDQATDRAFRIGQRRDVQVRRLVCAGTIEERIDELLSGKRALARAALTPGEAWLTDLPDDELAELVSLRGEGIDE
ncbi:MAG TPA: DEAD/DEAH box helicase [Kineosporiaceae bacterium]